MCVAAPQSPADRTDGLCRLAKDFLEMRETVVARSVDHGETFEAPVIVGHDKGVFPACPHRPASMGVDRQGRVYVVWYTEGTDEIPAVYIAYSDDRGQTVSPKQQLNVSRTPSRPSADRRLIRRAGSCDLGGAGPGEAGCVMSVSTDRGPGLRLRTS